MIGEYLLEQLDVIEGRTPGQTMSVCIQVDKTPVALWIHTEDLVERERAAYERECQKLGIVPIDDPDPSSS